MDYEVKSNLSDRENMYQGPTAIELIKEVMLNIRLENARQRGKLEQLNDCRNCCLRLII